MRLFPVFYHVGKNDKFLFAPSFINCLEQDKHGLLDEKNMKI